MEQVVSYAALGVMLGAIYALLAIGYTLVFGVLRILNLAHGDIFMVGAFVAAFMAPILAPWLAIPTGILVATFFGVALYFIVFEPTKSKEAEFGPAIGSLAFGLVLESVGGYLAGGYSLQFPALLRLPDLYVGKFQISTVQLVVLLIALAAMVTLNLITKRTKIGRSMRAIAESEQASRLLGINVRRVIVAVFALSSAGAGLAAVLYGLRYGVVDPYYGFHIGLIGLIVMVLGGIGNIIGAMVGGIVLGLVQMLATGLLWSGAQQVVPWIVLVVVLVLFPEGLLGQRHKEEKL